MMHMADQLKGCKWDIWSAICVHWRFSPHVSGFIFIFLHQVIHCWLSVWGKSCHSSKINIAAWKKTKYQEVFLCDFNCAELSSTQLQRELDTNLRLVVPSTDETKPKKKTKRAVKVHFLFLMFIYHSFFRLCVIYKWQLYYFKEGTETEWAGFRQPEAHKNALCCGNSKLFPSFHLGPPLFE